MRKLSQKQIVLMLRLIRGKPIILTGGEIRTGEFLSSLFGGIGYVNCGLFTGATSVILGVVRRHSVYIAHSLTPAGRKALDKIE